MYTFAMIDLPANNDNKKRFLQHKEKHKNIKEPYTNRSKHGKKGRLLSSIQISEKGLKLHSHRLNDSNKSSIKIEDKRWVYIYNIKKIQ